VLTEVEIERIVKRIIDGYAPLVVGLFGSYAIGTAHEGSDLDLFVIKQSLERPAARRRTIQRLLFGVMHKVDTPVFTPTEFEEGAYDEHMLHWVIVRQARLYYWSEEASSQVPSLRAACP
jgi:uncharacterized protein